MLRLAWYIRLIRFEIRLERKKTIRRSLEITHSVAPPMHLQQYPPISKVLTKTPTLKTRQFACCSNPTIDVNAPGHHHDLNCARRGSVRRISVSRRGMVVVVVGGGGRNYRVVGTRLCSHARASPLRRTCCSPETYIQYRHGTG